MGLVTAAAIVATGALLKLVADSITLHAREAWVQRINCDLVPLDRAAILRLADELSDDEFRTVLCEMSEREDGGRRCDWEDSISSLRRPRRL
ncbi:MAG: hypothetical protein GY767_22595 [Shimia sp.]|nr:hypothetical protein [Shimia sp.]